MMGSYHKLFDSESGFRPESCAIKLLHEDARVPTRGSTHSAGYDLYAPEEVNIPVGRRVLIKTGVAMRTPAGTYFHICPRSGLAHKNGIAVLGGVIDHDYSGEIGVILRNTGIEYLTLKAGDRIAQGIFKYYAEPELEVVDELPAVDSQRGEGGYGSTGK